MGRGVYRNERLVRRRRNRGVLPHPATMDRLETSTISHEPRQHRAHQCTHRVAGALRSVQTSFPANAYWCTAESGAVVSIRSPTRPSSSAHVIATASAQKSELVKRLGAKQVIDYRASRFERRARTGRRHLQHRCGGSRAAPGKSCSLVEHHRRCRSNESTTDKRVKDAFFMVEPNANQLTQVAQLIDQGNLEPFRRLFVPLSEAPDVSQPRPRRFRLRQARHLHLNDLITSSRLPIATLCIPQDRIATISMTSMDRW